MIFQSTLPAWGATLSFYRYTSFQGFQSTLPAWGATNRRRLCGATRAFQSTLPAWGATQGALRQDKSVFISIHAPRVGSDMQNESLELYCIEISIHAPRVGSDFIVVFLCAWYIFQSTLPAWGATLCSKHV